MAEITIYGTCWCGDCRRAKQFLRERKIPFREVNVDESPEAEELVLRVNNGLSKVPTIEMTAAISHAARLIPTSLPRN